MNEEKPNLAGSQGAMLEHVNVTVSNPEQTAELLCALFGWHVRWQGRSALGGRTVHVGTDDAYIAVYTTDDAVLPGGDNLAGKCGLNHIGVLVEDLDAAEQRVIKAGFKPFNHADYAPGRRFYFNDKDGLEYEIVSYAQA